MKEFDIQQDQQASLRQHIMSLLPILVINKSAKEFYYVNIWQIDLGITMEDLKNIEEEPAKENVQPAAPEPVAKATVHKKLGHRPLAHIFPNMVTIAT